MAELDITKIVKSGADTTKVYHKFVDSDPGTTTVAFNDTDLVTYLNDVSGFGSSKDVSSFRLYHKKDEVKTNKGSKVNDLSFTEVLTTDALTAMREAYTKDKFIVTAVFDEKGNQLYGAFGQISAWGMELPDDDNAKLTYTMSVSSDDIKCTSPEE